MGEALPQAQGLGVAMTSYLVSFATGAITLACIQYLHGAWRAGAFDSMEGDEPALPAATARRIARARRRARADLQRMRGRS